MSYLKSCLFGVGLAWASAASAEIEVIVLRHRTVDEVLPVVVPLMLPEGAATGMNGQLILRGSPSAIEDVRRVLSTLDAPLRRLRITVVHDVDEETVNRLLELSASMGGDRVRGRIQDARVMLDERKTQHVQVVEGGRASVRIGQSQPVVLRQQMVTPQGQVRVVETMQYRESGSGFMVQPSVSGERVTLEIQSQNDIPAAISGGYAREQYVSTRISGRLGEWLVLGDLDQVMSGGDSDIGRVSNSRGRGRYQVLLKVDEIR